nr:hypothetical protein [Tanacetum cinerariifolium]
MKESKAYTTSLGYATGAIPPTITREFKKTSPSKKDNDLVLVDEEPVTKGKRVKSSVKKSSTKPAASIITPAVTSEGTGDKLGVLDVTKDESTKSESESWGNDEDDNNDENDSKNKGNDDENKNNDLVPVDEEPVTKGKRVKSSVKKSSTKPATSAEKPPRVDKITPAVTSEGTGDKLGVLDVTKDESTESESESWGNDKDDNNDENDSKNKGNDDENKSDDDKIPSDNEKDSDSEQDTDGSESDFESDQQEYEEEIKDDDKSEGDEGRGMDDTTNQFSDDVQDKKETEVPDASISHSSDLASKFLNFLDIHPNDAEIVSPLDVHVHHEVPRIPTFTLLTVPVLVIPEASPILPEEVSNFAPPVIEKMIEESLNQVNLAKASSQPQSNYEAAATLIEFELKKILIDKMNSSESYPTAPEHRESYDGLIKSYNLDKDFFSSYDVYSLKRSRQDKDKDEGPSVGSDWGFKKRNTSKDAEPTTSMKNKDSTSRSSKGSKSQPKSSGKTVHSEEPEFKDFDELMSTPIDFSSYILNGLKIENLTQEILLGQAFRLLKGTRGFHTGENNVRPSMHMQGACNQEEMYTLQMYFGGHSCLSNEETWIWINDIEEMLLHVVQNRLTNLSGDDFADFAITLRMFTKSLVIQMRLKIFNLELKVIKSRSMSQKEQVNALRRTVQVQWWHVNQASFFARRHHQEYRHGVLVEEKMEHIRKEMNHFMIKDINKLLKEKRMMRSLEKFVGGRLYETDLRLLQRTI